MPNMKKALANPLHASDMLSFRVLHCGRDVSMQKPPKFARVLWVRGRVPQVCCGMVVCQAFVSKVVGWFVGLGRVNIVSDVHPCPIQCARKARFSENNHVPSKISGHENG